MTVHFTYNLIILFFTFSILLKFLEYLKIIKSFDKNGVLSFDIVGADIFIGKAKFFNLLYSKKGLRLILITGLIVYLLLWFSLGNNVLFRILLGIFIVLHLIVHYRHNLGLDGADQMNLIISLTLLLCFCFTDNSFIKQVGIIFIALQLSLSYLIAGIAKIISKTWRSGLATRGILSTNMFGSKKLRNALGANKNINIILSWITIIFEILFIAALFIPSTKVLIIFLVCGVLFHLTNAIIMGLNDFVWSFISAYPAIYFLHQIITNAIF